MTDKPRVEPSVSEPARCGASMGLGACEKPKGHTDAHQSTQFGYDSATWYDPEPVIALQPTPPTSGQRCQNCDAAYVNTNYAYCPACGSVMAHAIERNQQ